MTSASLTKRGSSLSVLSNAKARCWMRCLVQSCMRKLVNFLSSTLSHFTSLVDVTPPSSNTLSGEMSGSFRLREDYQRHRESCVFRGKIGPVGVLLILQLRGRSAVVVGEIFLDVGECCFQSRVAYDRYVGGRFCACCSVGSGCSLAAEDVFYTRDEVVECCHFLEFLLLVLELSSLIFSSRRCFWSRARAVSCTRSS